MIKIKAYHGSMSCDIKEFDYDLIGSNIGHSIGRGFYFADSKEVASGYATEMDREDYSKTKIGCIYECNLYLENKLSLEVLTFFKDEIIGIVENVHPEYMGNWYPKSVEEVVEEILLNEKNDVELIHELLNTGADEYKLFKYLNREFNISHIEKQYEGAKHYVMLLNDNIEILNKEKCNF